MQTIQLRQAQVKREKESIHSGQFMVSHFEAEEQDDEDEVALPIPEVVDVTQIVPIERFCEGNLNAESQPQLGIETSLTKLFQCMSLAYRQKLTSPKWNRFRGIKLRWKDKIRLNNVIWRCWHLQFIKKENTLICQFASPLDVDTHNKPEAVVLEGKYWKRKLAAVTAEYKKWRMFYRNHALGQPVKEDVEMLNDEGFLTWNTQSSENFHMMVDEDYMTLMTDTLFSTISNQPFVFPDSREIAKAGLADFIQPSLGPLQPDFDYMDTFDPLHEFMASKLPPVPEEQGHDSLFKQVTWPYSDLDLMTSNNSSLQMNTAQINYPQVQSIQQLVEKAVSTIPNRQQVDPQQQQQQQQQIYSSNDIILQQPNTVQYVQQPVPPPPPPSYHSIVISKNANKSIKNVITSTKHSKRMQQAASTSTSTSSSAVGAAAAAATAASSASSASTSSSASIYNNKNVNNVYSSYQTQTDPLQLSIEEQQQQQQQSIMSANQKLQQQFKLPHQSTDNRQSIGYKFTAPVIPNLKFTSQVSHMMHSPVVHTAHSQYHTVHPISKEDKPEPSRTRSASTRGRQRSRSNTREPIKRPPLISAISDPSLITPNNSVLLTQLLTNNTENSNVFNRSQSLITTRQQQQQQHDPLSNQVRIKEENNSPIPILPQPPPPPPPPVVATAQSATLIITPLNINPIQSPTTTTTTTSSSSDPLLLNSFSNSNSPILDSSQNLNSPTSSQGSVESPNHLQQHQQQQQQQQETLPHHKDHRRVGHIHAEQKRRYNIKTGFDMIHSLIPHLTQNPNAKLSKAAMLQKGAEYIRQLRSERSQLQEEMDCLRQQIETLNTSISNCQSMLPATGAPVSRRRGSKMQEMFDEYVRNRTMENWKYWIFSLLFRPLLTSFNNFVSTSSLDDLYRSTMLWVEQHCTLVDLRPIVLNSLRYLSGKTDILAEPEKLPEEIHQLVLSNDQK